MHFKIFLYQTYLELKRKLFIPTIIIFILVQVVILAITKTLEDNTEKALLYCKWSQSINTVLLFIIFSIFFAISWETIKEKKIAQIEFSKPISRNAYFITKFLCYSVFIFILSIVFGIISQFIGVSMFGKEFMNLKKLYNGIKIADYEAKNIKVEGTMRVGSKLKENVLIADLLNQGELELTFNVFNEYTGRDEYYFYFRVQISSLQNFTYMKFKISSSKLDENDFYQFDEKIVSMQPHIFPIPKRFFEKPSSVYVKIERLDKSVYVRFDQFEPQILFKKESFFKSTFKELAFQSIISWQSATTSFLLGAFTSPPTAIVGSLIFWIWANSKELLKAGRQHVKSKILTEDVEDKHHKLEATKFPNWLEKISLMINSIIDKAIPDFNDFSFTPLIEKKITVSDGDFILRILGIFTVTLAIVFAISFLFKLFEFPV